MSKIQEYSIAVKTAKAFMTEYDVHNALQQYLIIAMFLAGHTKEQIKSVVLDVEIRSSEDYIKCDMLRRLLELGGDETEIQLMKAMGLEEAREFLHRKEAERELSCIQKLQETIAALEREKGELTGKYSILQEEGVIRASEMEAMKQKMKNYVFYSEELAQISGDYQKIKSENEMLKRIREKQQSRLEELTAEKNRLARGFLSAVEQLEDVRNEIRLEQERGMEAIQLENDRLKSKVDLLSGELRKPFFRRTRKVEEILADKTDKDADQKKCTRHFIDYVLNEGFSADQIAMIDAGVRKNIPISILYQIAKPNKEAAAIEKEIQLYMDLNDSGEGIFYERKEQWYKNIC